MIGEITPLVKAAGRRTWALAASAHIGGSTVSASVLGLLLGTAGMVIGFGNSHLPLHGVAAAALLACAVRDAGIVRSALPSLQRQTPRWFRDQFAPGWFALLWGVDLGQGWTTRILYTGYYGLVVWALLRAEPVTAAVVLGFYGIGRALPVLVVGTFWAHMPFERVIRGPMFRQPLLQAVNAVALGLAGAFLMSTAF